MSNNNQDDTPMVICPMCRGKYHKIVLRTEYKTINGQQVKSKTCQAYDPNKVINGAMLRMVEPWLSRWGRPWQEHEATKGSQCTCPNCQAPYCNGRGKVTLDRPFIPQEPKDMVVPNKEPKEKEEQFILKIKEDDNDNYSKDYTRLKGGLRECKRCGEIFTKPELKKHKIRHQLEEALNERMESL